MVGDHVCMEELEAALEAVKEFGLPVCATMSFDTAGKTMMGITPANLSIKAKDLGLLGFGANCGIGASDLLATITDISRHVDPDTTVIAKANCGIPEFKDGAIVYTGTEKLMADYVHLAMNSGAKIIGGCCGTTFGHIKAMRQAMDEHQMNGSPSMPDIEEKIGKMSKGSRAIFLGDDSTPVKKRRSRRSK